MYNGTPETNKKQYLKHKVQSKHTTLNNKAKRNSIFIIDDEKNLVNKIQENTTKLKLFDIDKLLEELSYVISFQKPMFNQITHKIEPKKDVYYNYLIFAMNTMTKEDIPKLEYLMLSYNKIPMTKEMSRFEKMEYKNELKKLNLSLETIDEKMDGYLNTKKILDTMGYANFSITEGIDKINEMYQIFTNVDYQYKIKKIFEKYNLDIPERELSYYLNTINKILLLDQPTELNNIKEQNQIVQEYFKLDNDAYSQKEILLAKNLLEQDCRIAFLKSIINHIQESYIIPLKKGYFQLYFNQLDKEYYKEAIENYDMIEEEFTFANKKIKKHSEQIMELFEKCKNVFGINIDKDQSILDEISKYKVFDGDEKDQYNYICKTLQKTSNELYDTLIPIEIKEETSTFRKGEIDYFEL